MKVTVFNQPATPAEQEVFVKLVQGRQGSVSLVACEATGVTLHSGEILTLCQSGIRRTKALSPKAGFDLTSPGAQIMDVSDR